jgi:hypothetical protein
VSERAAESQAFLLLHHLASAAVKPAEGAPLPASSDGPDHRSPCP